MLFTLRAVHLSCHPQEIGTNGKSESQRSRLLQRGEVRFELNRLRLSPHRMGHWQSMPIRYGVICCVALAEMQGTVESVELGAAQHWPTEHSECMSHSIRQAKFVLL